MSALLAGVREFQNNVFPKMKTRFEELAGGQSPKALFIACSDSRVNPNLLTQTLPGELFVVRNAGNIVPDADDQQEGVLASIEYAVSVLGVPEIIVCGHSQCGAMTGLISLDSVQHLPLVYNWLQQSRPAANVATESADPKNAVWHVTLENIRLQLARLRRLPCVAERLESNQLTISGWCYRFESGEVFVLNSDTDQFESLT